MRGPFQSPLGSSLTVDHEHNTDRKTNPRIWGVLVLAIAILTFNTSPLHAQEELGFINHEVPPSYPNGDSALVRFFSVNLNFPENDTEKSSTIFLGFDIDTFGLANFNAIHRLPEGANIDLFEEELKRVLKLMPAWEPGIQFGTKVQTRFTMPYRICFR